ncbi:FCD domain-containing protein, partial [candidate division WOR-3 bacterium]|nr:FCD domain-containing protein [candidate division WOR-3 bacterium]
LEKFANGVIDLIKLTTRLSMNPRAACEEHREILTALKQHDLEKAVVCLEDHLERAKRDSTSRGPIITCKGGGERVSE